MQQEVCWNLNFISSFLILGSIICVEMLFKTEQRHHRWDTTEQKFAFLNEKVRSEVATDRDLLAVGKKLLRTPTAITPNVERERQKLRKPYNGYRPPHRRDQGGN